ncbi:hypothetical protein DL93DRAFT_2169444 [Clavulina sp. PMI_390]|nr:hypothetical protein DL93DRAFT_2169444 [Clavulina sp. PMI_390]
MSLLHDVLRPTGDVDAMTSRLKQLSVPDESPSSSRGASPTPRGADSSESSDDDWVNVVSAPGTPRRLMALSRAQSRNTSPTRSGARSSNLASSRPISRATSPRPPKVKAPVNPTDPFSVLKKDSKLILRIVSQLSDVKDLAACSGVASHWRNSKQLNYMWYRTNRMLELGYISAPYGMWTGKEAKENWRAKYMRTVRSLEAAEYTSTSRYGYSTPSAPSSGYSTPRSIREEAWAAEAQEAATDKGEMRQMYKEMGGRKARAKAKVGMGGKGKDRGGWGEISF